MGWQDEAKKILNDFYQNFEGAQWHEFNLKTDAKLLLAKICYAIFGEPTKEPTDMDDLSGAYEEKQREMAGKISQHLQNKVYKDVEARKFMFQVIFIICKEKDNPLHIQPLFCVFADGNPEKADCGRRYVDMSCRTYKDWTDWKENNTLPIMEYAYPKYGFFSCSKYRQYEFDEGKKPNIEFGESPRSSVGSQIARGTDIATSITGLVSGGIVIASMFTPIGPAVMMGTAIAGGSSALWGAGRSVERLVDKGKHDEDMLDLESWTHYLSLVAAPLAFSSSLFSARLAQGAMAEGRIFSSTMRTFVTTLNFASLGVSGTLVTIGFVNLIEKGRAGNLETLDLVQFSMSVFFFSNTFIKPLTASSIIKQAQTQHFQKVEANLKTDTAKQSFKQFMDDNKGNTGSIQDRSKIVRALNRLDDPNVLFNKVGTNYDQILIGGRKGKTFLVSHDGKTTRIHGNQRVLDVQIPNAPMKFSHEDYSKLEKRIGQHPDEISIKGKKIFKNASPQEKSRACRVINQNNEKVVKLGLKASEKLNVNNVNDMLDIIEIVNAECRELKESHKFNRPDQISHMERNMDSFVREIKNDVIKATEIRERTGLGFKTDLNAVYHYRKHYKEFFGLGGREPINIYLEHTPNELTNNYHDVRVDHFESGNVRKTFITPKNEMAITIENVGDTSRIASMYVKKDAYASFTADFNKHLSKNPGITTKFRIPDYSYMNHIHEHVFLATGQTCHHFILTLRNGKRYRFDRLDQTFQLL